MSAFLSALLIMRALRKKLQQEADLSTGSLATSDTLSLNVYNNIIQQLKQQKHEIQVKSQAEQNRSRMLETLNQAVLANLSCGVLVFGANGLVKSANASAKQILGFAALTSMSPADIFRDSSQTSSSCVLPENKHADQRASVAAEIEAVLREGGSRREVRSEYLTPSRVQRFLNITISPVRDPEGNLVGVTCLCNDVSQFTHLLREQELRRDIAAEKALELRTSLSTLSGFARQLKTGLETARATQLIADIQNETEQLERSIATLLREGLGCELPGENRAAAARTV